jgi:hypothetical protein
LRDDDYDLDPANGLADMAELDPPVACKMISDQQGISDKLEEMGLTVSFVGDIISGFVKDGYTPMVW